MTTNPDGIEFIAKVNHTSGDEERMIYGFASLTDDGNGPVVDRQGDVVTEPELLKAAHRFIKTARVGKRMHEGEPKAEVVESMVLRPDVAKAFGFEGVTKTGWMIGMKVHDDQMWEDIKKGKLCAFSIGGKGKRKPVQKGAVCKDWAEYDQQRAQGGGGGGGGGGSSQGRPGFFQGSGAMLGHAGLGAAIGGSLGAMAQMAGRKFGLGRPAARGAAGIASRLIGGARRGYGAQMLGAGLGAQFGAINGLQGRDNSGQQTGTLGRFIGRGTDAQAGFRQGMRGVEGGSLGMLAGGALGALGGRKGMALGGLAGGLLGGGTGLAVGRKLEQYPMLRSFM